MRWTIAFSGWTVLVWAGRLRNVMADESLSGTGLAWRLGLAATFVLLAFTTMAMLWRSRQVPAPDLLNVVRGFAIFTIVVWAIRGAGIVLDPTHGVAFKVVHTVLALVSSALAVLAVRESSAELDVEGEGETATTSTRFQEL